VKVRCDRLVDATTGEEVTSSEWLRVGADYVVLSILAEPGRQILFRIMGEGEIGAPGLFDSTMFSTVSPEIPPSWVITVGNGGIVRVGPRTWMKPGFWEDYFNQEPEAIALFDEEYGNMLAESG
jgi:hypothetical protein